VTVKQDASRLRAVVDTAVDGVILIDAMGNVLEFNPACEKLFGYAAEEVLGRNVKLLMPAPFRDEHDRYLENYRTTGERKIIGIGREVIGQRKDGSTFPMDLSVGEAKENGEAIFVGIIHDLTEREGNARALYEGAAQLRAVVDTAVDGVILIDAHGTILMFNPACEKLFGFAAHEAIGQNVKLLMPPPFRDEHDSYLENYHTTGERKIIGIGREVVGQRKDGSTFPMDLSVGEATQTGESIFVGIIHDLSERKRTEEQLIQAQKMETVGHLSGGIAHDFNNLLTVMIGNAETLREKLKARADLKYLCDSIVFAGERGAELTHRLLAFSRRQLLQPTEIDCNELIERMDKLIRRTLREDIDIRVVLGDRLPAVLADPAQLESAVLNLALNAQDAMPTGGCLTISTERTELDERYLHTHPEVRSGEYIMVAITDDGTGIPPDVLKQVFEPFFTTKAVGKGSGLGLSMVYGFIKQSNGHVSIYSEPGLGTTVRLYLPTSPGDSRARVEASSPAGLVRGTETILVVEDDPFVRGYAVASLEDLGYQVIMAENGVEALTRLNEVTPDLLFTDVVMPGGVNGWELAERAKQLQPGLKVLLTSGYPLETLTSRGRVSEEAHILNKPYRKTELASRLRIALGDDV
jgi:PAS domain S-box-containing protein